MIKMTISCKEATEFISKKEEGKLTFGQQLQLWQHLGICGLCKLFAKQNKIITKVAKDLQDHIQLSLSENEKKLIIDKLQSS